MDMNFSIIIPTKNIPDLLTRCIDSIPIREDLEVIIVDDNSDPEIVDFNNYPGLNLRNFKVIFSKEGRGAGAARNLALKEATGKWLLFADSDDFFLEGFNEFLDKYKEDESDVVYFLPLSADCDTLEFSKEPAKRVRFINKFTGNDNKLNIYLRYYFTEPWCKLIKHSLIKDKNIKFEESMVANDYWFSVNLGYYASGITLDYSHYYCYTVRKGSLSNNPFDRLDKVISRLNVYDGIQKFAQRHEIKLKPFDIFILNLYMHYNSEFNSLDSYFKEKGISKFRMFRILLSAFFYKIYTRKNIGINFNTKPMDRQVITINKASI